MSAADRLATAVVCGEPRALALDLLSRGWSDGLPVHPPTAGVVDELVDASGLPASRSLGVLHPSGRACTVDLLAVNAAIAGAPPEAMPLLCATVAALADPAFDLAGVNATTASVVPAVVVNGPVRGELGLPCEHSAWGGAAGPAPAVGRALRLVMRNVAGQVPGLTSESVFGQPGRVCGIVTAEWEEASPWPPLAQGRGSSGDAVTVFGVLGTSNIASSLGTDADVILEVIGKSLAFIGNNNFDKASQFAHQLVAINPVWAEIVGRRYGNVQDVQLGIHMHARLPLDWFPTSLREAVAGGKRTRDGWVYLMDGPDDLSVVVNGGRGSLHAHMFPGMSHVLPVTRSLDPATWPPTEAVT